MILGLFWGYLMSVFCIVRLILFWFDFWVDKIDFWVDKVDKWVDKIDNWVDNWLFFVFPLLIFWTHFFCSAIEQFLLSFLLSFIEFYWAWLFCPVFFWFVGFLGLLWVFCWVGVFCLIVGVYFRFYFWFIFFWIGVGY